MWCNRDGFASTGEDPEWPLISERKVVNTSWFYDFHSVGLFPLTPPSPLGRGRISHRACANPERLDSPQRGMRCSLSQRERARVRGNETPPTKTAGRILQAQLDRFPEPMDCATQKQISRRALRTTGVSRQVHWSFERCFPLTPALFPWGEGEDEAPPAPRAFVAYPADASVYYCSLSGPPPPRRKSLTRTTSCRSSRTIAASAITRTRKRATST